MTAECVSFILKMAESFQIRGNICGTALTIMHYYLKKVPYTEFDRFMLSTLCLFLACKIDYKHMKYEQFIHFYYTQRKGPKSRNKPFEEIKLQLQEDFVDLEFKILSMIQFDFNFDLPYDYITNVFRK